MNLGNSRFKFRAWDKEYNFMIEPDDIAPFNYELITGNGRVMEIEERHSVMGTETNFNDISDKRILMQFTGLKDKNGKEIYEGDILDWEVNSSNDMYLGAGEVVYIEGAFWACGRYLSEMVRYHSAEVIGNIYENPNLLGK